MKRVAGEQTVQFLARLLVVSVGVSLFTMTVTLAGKGGNKPGSEAAHFVRADLPGVNELNFQLFSDTEEEVVTCYTDGSPYLYDYAHRDDDCEDFGLNWVRSDLSAGERWMFGIGHDFQTPGDISQERKIGIDFGFEIEEFCDDPSDDCYANKRNSGGESLEDRLVDCELAGNGCTHLGDPDISRAWTALGQWTMDKVFQVGVERHELTIYLKQVGDGELKGLTHFEYINPVYVCPGETEDVRIVQTWGPCGCYEPNPQCDDYDDVSEAEVRIGNPGAKKKSDRTTVVGRYNIHTRMTIEKAGPMLP